jgi:cullin 3
MIILSLFNDVSELRMSEILYSTDISESDFKCNMVPVLGLKILMKEPDRKEFNGSDVFRVNCNFKSNHYRLKVPVAVQKEAKEKVEVEVQEKVDEDRRHLIEATIVKVMKARRRLDHNNLIAETTKLLTVKF